MTQNSHNTNELHEIICVLRCKRHGVTAASIHAEPLAAGHLAHANEEMPHRPHRQAHSSASLLAGVLILIVLRLLNHIVAANLMVVGLLGLFGDIHPG